MSSLNKYFSTTTGKLKVNKSTIQSFEAGNGTEPAEAPLENPVDEIRKEIDKAYYNVNKKLDFVQNKVEQNEEQKKLLANLLLEYYNFDQLAKKNLMKKVQKKLKLNLKNMGEN